MVFKTCTYCELFEMDEEKLFSSIKDGVKKIHSIHITCKELKENDSKIKKELRLEAYRISKKKNKDTKTIIDNLNNTPEKKYCKKCDKDKHISEFYMRRDFSFYPHCKTCHGNKTKAYAVRNKEKIKDYQKVYSKAYYEENKSDRNSKKNKWLSENKDKVEVYRKSYYEKNKATYSENSKLRYQKDKQNIIDKQKTYYLNNREVIIERNKLRYKEKKEKDGKK